MLSSIKSVVVAVLGSAQEVLLILASGKKLLILASGKNSSYSTAILHT